MYLIQNDSFHFSHFILYICNLLCAICNNVGGGGVGCVYFVYNMCFIFYANKFVSMKNEKKASLLTSKLKNWDGLQIIRFFLLYKNCWSLYCVTEERKLYVSVKMLFLLYKKCAKIKFKNWIYFNFFKWMIK